MLATPGMKGFKYSGLPMMGAGEYPSEFLVGVRDLVQNFRYRFSDLAPGARFSKVPVTYRAR